jgi:hypothetical protein
MQVLRKGVSMKKFYWFPKLMKIEIEQYETKYNPCFTTTQKYFWRGYRYFNWLWLKNIKLKFKGFEIWNSRLEFKKTPPKGVKVEVLYSVRT